ncbi:MAG: hypothetical protein L0221_17370 [Chloroflexi bacterium]|nr:hypothetical protein [Chloroflexota bacterium]
MHYYELHEGDDDVFSDLILAREEEMDADEFFSLVQDIRRRVQDAFETDTLIEAIAEELEVNHGFTFISDDRLTAAVNVSTKDSENFLADLDDNDSTDGADYRAVIADFDPDALERN